MPLSDREVSALVASFQQLLEGVSDQLADEFEAAFRGLSSWDRVNVREFMRATAPLWRSHAQVVADLTAAMLSDVHELGTVAVDIKELRAITPAPDISFRTLWKRLGEGVDFEAGFDEAVRVVRSQARSSMYRVSRASTPAWVGKQGLYAPFDKAVAENPAWRPSARVRAAYDRSERVGARVVGYRRVLTGKSCSWCARVSTQRYLTADSADFGHPRCDCTVIPIVGTRDPGQVLNRDLLDALDVSGASRVMDESKMVKRLSKHAEDAAWRRDAVLDELLAEADDDRRARLEKRAHEWNDKAMKYRAEAADLRTEHVSVGAPRYVDSAGRPVD